MEIPAACFGMDNIYFINQEFMSLMKMNLMTCEIHYVVTLCQNIGIVRKMIFWNKQVWLFSIEKATILIYDLCDKNWSILNHSFENGIGGFCGIRVKNFYYGFSKKMCKIMKVNLSTREISLCFDGKKEFARFENNPMPDDVFCKNCCLANGKIYSITGYNFILEYDYKKNRGKFYSIEKEGQFATICFDGDYFWLTGTSKDILKWNYKTNKVVKIPVDTPKFDFQGKMPFRSSLFFNGYIYLFSSSANRNIRININQDRIEENYIFYGDRRGTKTLWSLFLDNEIIFMDTEKREFVKEDRNKNMNRYSLTLSNEQYEELAEKYIKYSVNNSLDYKFFLENRKYINLRIYLNELTVQNEKKTNITEQQRLDIGSAIYRILAL